MHFTFFFLNILLRPITTVYYFWQENKAREVADVKRRHADRLQSGIKRRSIATCSARDKELDGVTLESVLQNLIGRQGSRRKTGRPFSTHGTPDNGSPMTGSLFEITSQSNLPNVSPSRSGYFKVKEMSRKGWNSAADLTNTSNIEKKQPNNVLNENVKQDPKMDENLANKISSGRPVSTIEDTEEDFQDNNEEEAQKLRDASKKVIRFQSSRGSVSSFDSSSEKPKFQIQRQRTIDEDLQSDPNNPTNEDLVTFLLNPQSPTKRNLGRRHTLPTKVHKTEENDDDWNMSSPRTPQKNTSEDKENSSSKQVFDFSDISQNLTSEGDHKSKPSSMSLAFPEESLQAQSQDSQPTEKPENIPPKSGRRESTGLFFNFFKRFQFPTNKETLRKSSDSSV